MRHRRPKGMYVFDLSVSQQAESGRDPLDTTGHPVATFSLGH